MPRSASPSIWFVKSSTSTTCSRGFEMKEKTILYDNTPDMEIKLEDGRIVTLDEMESMVRMAGKLFAYAPWSTSNNPRPTRIIASISADGLSLHDFKTGISHRW